MDIPWVQRLAREFQIAAGHLQWSDDPQVGEVLARLAAVLATDDPLHQRLLEGMLAQLTLRWLARLHGSQPAACCWCSLERAISPAVAAQLKLPPARHKDDRSSPLGRVVQQYVAEHYAGAMRLKDLARALGTTPRHIEREFAKSFGGHLHDYVVQVRALKAIELVTHEQLKVEAAAHAVGFASRASLYRAWKKHKIPYHHRSRASNN